MVFGLKLNLTLQEQNVESLRFSINGQYSREYNIPVSEGFAALEIPYITLGVPECTGCAIALDFTLVEDYQENISISIGTVENHTRFFDGDITVKRNKMMTIELNPKETESSSQGAFNITFKEEMMEENIDLK